VVGGGLCVSGYRGLKALAPYKDPPLLSVLHEPEVTPAVGAEPVKGVLCLQSARWKRYLVVIYKASAGCRNQCWS
jgi:hypothetical protein